MLVKIKVHLLRFITYKTSAQRLAFAAALAVYIAFSPFVGLHTFIALALGAILRLNIPLMLFVGNLVNNPFTMIPIYMSGYLFGHWCLHSWWQVPIAYSNPSWIVSVNHIFIKYLALENVSFWAFMVGANILGIVFAFVSYLVFEMLFIYLAKQRMISKVEL